MATEGQISLGTNSNLDLIRQRAQKAAEFYQQQQVGYTGGDQLSNLAQSSHSSANHQLLVLPQYSENYGTNYNSKESIGGDSVFSNVSRVLSDESFESALAPASSDSFYRAKMRSGIIDMRSSYNERYSGNNSRARARTFHGPHTGNRPRTHTYAVENNQPSLGQSQQPVQPPKSVTTTQYQSLSLQQPAPQKPARMHVTNKAQQLCRSSSDLEVDTGETDAPPPAPSSLHREYGSTSSLDMLGTNDNFFNMLNEFRNQALDQRSPAPPHLKELLKGRLESFSEPLIQRPTDFNKGAVKFINGSASGDKETVDDVDGLKSNKSKSKHKERKQRAKSITGEGSASILKKLRGKVDSDLISSKTDDRGISEDSQSRSEEHLRRLAFVHFDCQSVGVDLEKVIQQRLLGLSYKTNISTGASAASGQRTSLAPDKDDPDILADTDEGDGKANELVLSCPFFRNEVGGEDERTVSLTKITAHKRLAGDNSTSVPSNNTKSQLRHPACCGVAILDSSPSPSGQILPPLVSHHGHVIEYVDHGAYYYRHFFYNHEHQNLFGLDDNLGPVAISIRREKLDLNYRANNLGRADYGTSQYRIICRTSELTTLRGCILEDAIPSRMSSSRGVPLKDILEMTVPEVQISCLRQAIAGPKTCEQLLKLDEQGISNTYKVGILYCKSGQSTEEEMYNNEYSDSAFEEFLNLISQKVRLKGFENYRAGLDCKTDTTGTHSYYTTFNNNEIMFHVSTLLPFTPNNKQQLLRKRHIGNDIVTIVFQEPGALPFTPQTVRSQFQHVFIIVRVSNPNTDSARYSVAITRSKDVPPFGPPIPQNCSFKKTQDFVDFLLAKVINAENAAHRSEKFLTMATRTRQEYLKDLATNYITSTSVDSGSKLSKFGLGSGRKKEKPKQKVIPDMFAKGAVVWEVQVEDMGTASQVECLLAIAADTIVLVEQTNKDVIFTIPSSTVIGWTHQPTSLRLYFGAGECLLLRPMSGDSEEMLEIITRLQGVTHGTETSKMALKRNGLGQLGFHIQSEGIVTDVEPYGFAWESGLRKGSRLVEICKVATTTLSHEQIVDLLRTSAVVKVVVVPPLEDGSPRGDNSLTGSTVFTNTNLRQPSPSAHHKLQQNTVNYEQRIRPSGGQHGYSDSTLSSGRSSDDGRNSSFSHSRQDSTDLQGCSHESHTSSGEEPQSHDSSDYSMSAISLRSRSNHHNQPLLRRGERVLGSIDMNMDGSIYLQSGNNAISKRQFVCMEYQSGIPATGNIALELLKQTQNTKYLLGQSVQNRLTTESVRQSHDGVSPGSATNLSQISDVLSAGSVLSQYAHHGDSVRLMKDEVTCRKEALARANKPVMKKGFTEPPVSSPKSSRRNLSGIMSEESLPSRRSPGTFGQKQTKEVIKADFQEELMRLIDPDLSENDLVGFNSRSQAVHKPVRLHRTLSDESLKNTKVACSNMIQNQGTDSASQRLSPRAVSDLANARQRSKSTMDNRVPLMESAAALDWSKLVNVASKAIDETDSSSKYSSRSRENCQDDENYLQDDHPPPRPPFPEMSMKLSNSPSGISSYGSLIINPQQRILELEERVTKLCQELEKVRQDKSEMEMELQDLRTDNVRLQEESQTAATQLRRFTEWFFNTIDRQ